MAEPGAWAEWEAGLRRIHQRLTSKAKPQRLLRTITEHAVSLFAATAGQLFLYRPERGSLDLAAAAGVGKPSVGPLLVSGKAFARRVWESGAPLILDMGKGLAEPVEPQHEHVWGIALGAPVAWGGESLGVLGVLDIRPGTLTAADGRILELLASQAAVTIVNARLNRTIERLAVMDHLTGVLNRHGLLAVGQREVRRARRFRRPLAMLFVDLDDFKELNDTYSHRVGDQMLREIGARLAAGVREADVVGRFGGDEFVVLLVETGLPEACEVAERLRRAVEATHLATARGEAHGTVSIGVAEHDGGTPSFDALLGCADDAMYAAKKAGRNRVATWPVGAA